jgi:hypothetical protein
MKILNLLFVLCFTGLSAMLYGQDYAVDKKATLLSLTGSYINSGGSLFEDSYHNKSTTISFSPSVSHFVSKNFFIGGGFATSVQSQGSSTAKSFAIGPVLGYAFGTSASTAFPYFDLGLRYYNLTTDNGYNSNNYDAAGREAFMDFGVIFPIKSHIGLTFEGGYHSLKLKMKDYTKASKSGSIFSLSMGFVGLLF